MKKEKLLLTFLLFFLFAVYDVYAYFCKVEKILDGDTFICSGEKVRLIGIDTPESTINPNIEKQRSLGDTEIIIRLGKMAKKFVKKVMPEGTTVRLEFDIQKRDKYGRTSCLRVGA